jgi:hypothetical protein
MADEYSATILHDSQQQHSVTQLWRHTVQDGILHKNLKFRQFTYTTAQFTATVFVTASDGTDRTEQNVQCSNLSLYRQTVYSGKYSGHFVLLVLLIEWLLFIIW